MKNITGVVETFAHTFSALKQGLPKQKKVDTFIYIIRLRVAYPVLGMVRFRRSTSFCDGRGWVVLTTDYDE